MRWVAWDWKFVLSMCVTLAGVVVPLLWQSDSRSKGLELHLTSVWSLQPPSQIRNVQVMVDGKTLDTPFASTLVLLNSGSESIMSKDFETPIEVTLEDGARFANAQVTTTIPKDLPVDLTVSDQSLKIGKHLSNPGDSITVSVVTSGEPPKFGVKSRIAGISQIAYQDHRLPEPAYKNTIVVVLLWIVTIGLFTTSQLCLMIKMTPASLTVPNRVLIIVGGSTYLGTFFCYTQLVARVDFLSTWNVLSVSILSAVPIFVWMVCRHLRRTWINANR